MIQLITFKKHFCIFVEIVYTSRQKPINEIEKKTRCYLWPFSYPELIGQTPACARPACKNEYPGLLFTFIVIIQMNLFKGTSCQFGYVALQLCSQDVI